MAYKYDAKEIEQEVSEDEFDDFIDECEEVITIFGMKFNPSRILKELDPIAYRCSKSDYESTLDTQYECPICGQVHDFEDDALDCCVENIIEEEEEEEENE